MRFGRLCSCDSPALPELRFVLAKEREQNRCLPGVGTPRAPLTPSLSHSARDLPLLGHENEREQWHEQIPYTQQKNVLKIRIKNNKKKIVKMHSLKNDKYNIKECLSKNVFCLF